MEKFLRSCLITLLYLNFNQRDPQRQSKNLVMAKLIFKPEFWKIIQRKAEIASRNKNKKKRKTSNYFSIILCRGCDPCTKCNRHVTEIVELNLMVRNHVYRLLTKKPL